MPKISVIIIAKDARATIPFTLESLRKQSRGPDETIVVVPSEDDNTLEALKNYPEAKAIISGKPTRGYQRAVGVRNAIGDVIAFIDADCVAEASWLETMERVYASNGNVMIQGGPTMGVSDLRRLPQVNPNKDRHKLRVVRFLCGANLSFRVGLLTTSGNFDEELHEGEDMDFCVRVLRHGIKIIMNPQATVYHLSNGSGFSLSRPIMYGQSRALVLLLHGNEVLSEAMVAVSHIALLLFCVAMLIAGRYELSLAAIALSLLHQVYKLLGYGRNLLAPKDFLLGALSSYVLYFSFMAHVVYYALQRLPARSAK